MTRSRAATKRLAPALDTINIFEPLPAPAVATGILVNAALVQTVLKKKTPRLQWHAHYELDLGLEPVETRPGCVTQAWCKFCKAFGREVDAEHPFVQLHCTNQRKMKTTTQVFTSFRRDKIVKHHKSQHAAK